MIDRLIQDGQRLSTPDFVTQAVSLFGDGLLLASSMGAEDQVLTHMLAGIDVGVRIITLDTGRLPQQTYDVIEQTHARYGIRIQLLHPSADLLEKFTGTHGPNAFYRSVELRKECCHIRKVLPLRAELERCTAWISGIRRGQSLARSAAPIAEIDQAHDCIKLNPLVYWSEDEVWEYIRANRIPYNALHDQGYPSIGCAPCTRAVKPGEDPRAGRWWWEHSDDDRKECGIHSRKETG